MVDNDLSQRFARSYTTAAFGYARAASAAYAALATQTLDFWSVRGDRSARADRPHFVSGPHPFRSAYAPAEAAPTVDFVRLSQAWAASPMFAPMRAWWSLFPFESNPASWPMAHAMMSAGVPRSVAVPAAEANVAAMDAAQVAQASVNRAFSAYRSDSGFAVTQVLSPKTLFGTMFLAPFTSTFKFPWG